MQNDTGMQTVQPVPPQPQEPRPVSKSLFIVVTVLVFVSLAGLLLTAALSGFAAIGLYGANRRLDAQVKSLSSRVDSLEIENRQLWIASDMLTDGYTDDICTFNILFCSDDAVVLDATPQGTLGDNYDGKGKFSVSDSLLKKALEKYVLLFRDVYNDAKLTDMTDFASLKLRIEMYGYDLATYENGAIKLVKDK